MITFFNVNSSHLKLFSLRWYILGKHSDMLNNEECHKTKDAILYSKNSSTKKETAKEERNTSV